MEIRTVRRATRRMRRKSIRRKVFNAKFYREWKAKTWTEN